MMPQYKTFLNRVALQTISRSVDIPSPALGVSPFECLEPLNRSRIMFSQPSAANYADAKTGGLLVGQTYFGVPGFGSLIPEVEPGDIPYYGESLGGE